VYQIISLREALQKSVSIPQEQAAAFFKTGPGDYAEGDIFMGVPVPALRKIAKVFKDLDTEYLQQLLASPINEERLLALIILTNQYAAGTTCQKEELYGFYIKNLDRVNNWNLVDASAHLIVGAHLHNKDREILLTLAQSPLMWYRRVAIVATWYFIRQNDLHWTFRISRILLGDTHDLIHKAVGWMLREAGKKDTPSLVAFLEQHHKTMPRTMLRYSIEKFDEKVRKKYLKKSDNATFKF
jgi:3-methyladenine DNA glycosylase AlkD